MTPNESRVEPADVQETPVNLACAVCEREVPISEVVVAEATDYVVNLCGLDCYQRWRRSAEGGA